MVGDEFSTHEIKVEKLGEVLRDMQRIIDQLPEGHITSASKTDNRNLCFVGAREEFSQHSDVGDKPVQPPIRVWTHPSIVLAESRADPPEQVDSTDCKYSSEEHTATQLSIFFEDMRKTIKAWQGRYWSLVEGKGNLRLDEARNNHKIDQLDFGSDSGEAIAVTGTLKLLQPSSESQRGQALRTLENAHNHYPFDMEPAFAVQSHLVQNNAVYKYGDASIQEREDDPVLPNIVKFDLSSKKRKRPQKKTISPVISQDLTIRKFEYKVEVVESPPWLPKGWITELKTRSSGGSAGCKDKYYYDPVSKRRCRSQKEVFSLIETGKLGRYKRRLKLPLDISQSGEEHTSMEQATSLDGHHTNLKIKNKQGGRNKLETAVASPTLPRQQNPPGSSATALAISSLPAHHTIVSNMFLPHRTGQPSEWLMCDSLNLPRNMFDDSRHMDSSNGELGWQRPRYHSTSDNTVRPFIDRFELLKSTENGENATLARYSTEMTTKRARKPSKKTTTVFSM